MQYEILEEWDSILDEFPADKKDIYFSHKYLTLYENEEKKALCAVCKEGGSVLLMPFLRGEIEGFYDFESAYGYGGPISNTDDSAWNREAFCGIHDYLKSNKYLCGFTRFHPLINNVSLLADDESNDITGRIQLIYDRPTVYIDTSEDSESIWSNQISSKNRNMIRKAENNQLEYKAEYDFRSYEEFIELYIGTMRRLSAEDFYYFDRDYYFKLKDNFEGSSFLGTVRKDGKLICAAIFLYSELFGHYHLEGSDRDYSRIGANNYLLWKTACEMHDLGINKFHLGGGTSSSLEDPLYKFKKVFSVNQSSFYIGKQVFDNPNYLSICDEWSKQNPDKADLYGNRLLKYRY